MLINSEFPAYMVLSLPKRFGGSLLVQCAPRASRCATALPLVREAESAPARTVLPLIETGPL